MSHGRFATKRRVQSRHLCGVFWLWGLWLLVLHERIQFRRACTACIWHCWSCRSYLGMATLVIVELRRVSNHDDRRSGTCRLGITQIA